MVVLSVARSLINYKQKGFSTNYQAESLDPPFKRKYWNLSPPLNFLNLAPHLNITVFLSYAPNHKELSPSSSRTCPAGTTPQKRFFIGNSYGKYGISH
jgi:hypothetical protein